MRDSVPNERYIPAFLMYCVYGESRLSLLIESTNSLIFIYIYIAGDLHAVAHKMESISQKLLLISNGDILMTVYNNNYIYYSKRNFQKYLCTHLGASLISPWSPVLPLLLLCPLRLPWGPPIILPSAFLSLSSGAQQRFSGVKFGFTNMPILRHSMQPLTTLFPLSLSSLVLMSTRRGISS